MPLHGLAWGLEYNPEEKPGTYDTEALQDAINAAAIRGEPLHLSAGEYRIDAPLVPKTTIVGVEGSGTVIKTYISGEHGLFVADPTDAQEIRIEKIHVEYVGGDRVPVVYCRRSGNVRFPIYLSEISADGLPILDAQKCYGHVRHCEGVGTPLVGVGIALSRCDGLAVEDCDLSEYGNGGIAFQYCGSLYLGSNRTRENDYTGIYGESSNAVTLHHNNCSLNDQHQCHMIGRSEDAWEPFRALAVKGGTYYSTGTEIGSIFDSIEGASISPHTDRGVGYAGVGLSGFNTGLDLSGMGVAELRILEGNVSISPKEWFPMTPLSKGFPSLGPSVSLDADQAEVVYVPYYTISACSIRTGEEPYVLLINNSSSITGESYWGFEVDDGPLLEALVGRHFSFSASINILLNDGEDGVFSNLAPGLIVRVYDGMSLEDEYVGLMGGGYHNNFGSGNETGGWYVRTEVTGNVVDYGAGTKVQFLFAGKTNTTPFAISTLATYFKSPSLVVRNNFLSHTDNGQVPFAQGYPSKAPRTDHSIVDGHAIEFATHLDYVDLPSIKSEGQVAWNKSPAQGSPIGWVVKSGSWTNMDSIA